MAADSELEAAGRNRHEQASSVDPECVFIFNKETGDFYYFREEGFHHMHALFSRNVPQMRGL